MFVLFSSLFLLCAQFAFALVVNTSNGPVRGLSFDNYSVFRGIPFAEPPVGPLRWAAPVAKKPWGPTTLDATEWKPACPQDCHMPNGLCPTVLSEDCLYLDVWMPATAQPGASSLSVMVFFYGGAFFQGAGNTPIYWSDYVANHTDTIIVTLEYRLAALGFMVTDEFPGNFGLMDQNLALQWVQKNIAQFGGNPNHVTIFGESAGAMSTGLHLISPASKGLFHAAIMESNPYGFEYKTAKEAKQWGRSLASKLGCKPSDTACLRAVPWKTVLEKQGKAFGIDLKHLLANLLPWTPNIDGNLIPHHPLYAMKNGEWNQMPVLLGTNQNEGIEFVWDTVHNISDIEYQAFLLLYFNVDYLDMRDLYPSVDGNQFFVVSRLITDFLFQCATRRVAEHVVSAGQPAFLYRFDHAISFKPWRHYSVCNDPKHGACHGAELPFVFHSAHNANATFTPEEDHLSDQMVHFWTNFARTHNPNTGDFKLDTKWPQFTTTNYAQILLETPLNQQETNYNADACKFWDSYYAKHQETFNSN